MSSTPPPASPPPRRSRTFAWMMAVLGLSVVTVLLLVLMPLNGWVIATLLLFVGVLLLTAAHHAFWSWLEASDRKDVVIPPDRQGRRGPPHRNGSPRPGDPFYCK